MADGSFSNEIRCLETLSKSISEIHLWSTAADAAVYQADDVLLAILGFPKNVSLFDWCAKLDSKISECSLALLPGLLLRLEASSLEAANSDSKDSTKMLQVYHDHWIYYKSCLLIANFSLQTLKPYSNFSLQTYKFIANFSKPHKTILNLFESSFSHHFPSCFSVWPNRLTSGR